MTSEGSFKAIVEKIITKGGRHGPYVVARSDVLGSVTFSLSPAVWQEKDLPELGMFVILSKVRKKRAGWRAMCGRFMEPSDEQQPAKREQRA